MTFDPGILSRYLRDVSPWLADPEVIEIMANPDGSIFVERLGSGIARVGNIAPDVASMIVRHMGASQNMEVSATTPIVSGELPGGGHRFEGLTPPTVSEATFSIRRHAANLFPLSSYVERDALSSAARDCLIEAITAKANILLVGSTGSGKTTFLNALIHALEEIEPDARLLIIEDTREIRTDMENAVFLKSTPEVDATRILKSCMRLRPDRILVGEVRDGAALAMLKAWNTGHPGGMASIHANSASDALLRIDQLVGEVSVQPQNEVIASAVDLVVFLTRGPKGPLVQEIRKVVGYDGRFITEEVSS